MQIIHDGMYPVHDLMLQKTVNDQNGYQVHQNQITKSKDRLRIPFLIKLLLIFT